jgi:hypothetical protein
MSLTKRWIEEQQEIFAKSNGCKNWDEYIEDKCDGNDQLAWEIFQNSKGN